MARLLRFVTLVSASMVFIGSQEASASGRPTITSGEADCTAHMNEPRKKVGFSPFTKATEKKDMLLSAPGREENAGYMGKVCETLAKNPPGLPTEFLEESEGTVAFSIQTGDNADCEAAVKEWQGALTKFSSLPPSYTKNKEPYTSSGAISFIALFNPNENPTVDCQYFKCPLEEAGASEQNPTTKTLKAVVCLTRPPALTDNKAPFTQEQWDKIKTKIPGSDSGNTAVASTFVVLTAVALGVSLF